MADAVVAFLVKKLGNWLSEKATNFEKYKVHNVKIEVEKMKHSELMEINSFLKHADARQSKEERVRQWVREIRALTYRIEDVIETFDIRVESRNEMSINERIFERILKTIIELPDIKYLASREVQLEIDTIKNEYTILQQTKETYGIADYYPKIEEVLFRMAQEVDLLVSRMFYESRNYQIISICGMVDIGRTTLARKLCIHRSIKQHFEAIAQVDIPEEFSTEIIFVRILSQFSQNPEQKKGIRDVDEKELVTRLLTFQKEHKCLTVLHNIPSTDAWKKLRIAFPFGNAGSKILITTRSREVAEIATAGMGLIHTMSSLSEEDGWQLLSQYVSVRDAPEIKAVDSEMDNIEGLTSDILARGETLKIKYASQQLKIVHENNEVSAETERVQQALTSTYNSLPYQLKSCLFYLATFPKGRKIEAEKIYHLWMAEELLSSDNYQSETMMQMAETYLHKLHLAGMVYVQEEDVTTTRSFKSCSLHNLIHDFCLLMGRQEEFTVVKENEQELDFDPSFWTDRTWRLVINLTRHDNNKSFFRLNKKLRCLRVGGENPESDTNEMLADILNCLMKWRCLRILDFDGIHFGSRPLPKGIANLVHLRYLSLMGCLLKKLPPSVCKLPYLQILDLRVRTGCEMEIPNVLRNMKRLRHLYLPPTFRTRGGVKLRLDGLTELETLENFNTEVCNVEDLSTLTKVRYLTVNAGGSLEDLKRLVEHMKKLDGLTECEGHSSLDVRDFDCYTEERHSVFRELLACTTLNVLNVEGHLGQIPPYDKISKDFTKIVLSGSELQFDPMPTLEMLPNLRVLILFDDAFVGEKMTCSASRFPELKCLELSNLHGLESWSIEEKAMPKLSTLKIENCSQLKMLPDGLRFLEKLQELVLSGSEHQINPMPTLEMLSNLRKLIMNNNDFVGTEIICSASKFPELRHLELSNLRDLESWKVAEKAISKLSTLVIGNCSQLKMLPDGLQFLTNLRELNILRMPIAFKDRLRIVKGVRGADMDKVPHASIIFDNDNDESSE